jgi:hypothetical protein
MIKAIVRNDLETVMRLSKEHGANFFDRSCSALRRALKCRHLEIVSFILDIPDMPSRGATCFTDNDILSIVESNNVPLWALLTQRNAILLESLPLTARHLVFLHSEIDPGFFKCLNSDQLRWIFELACFTLQSDLVLKLENMHHCRPGRNYDVILNAAACFILQSHYPHEIAIQLFRNERERMSLEAREDHACILFDNFDGEIDCSVPLLLHLADRRMSRLLCLIIPKISEEICIEFTKQMLHVIKHCRLYVYAQQCDFGASFKDQLSYRNECFEQIFDALRGRLPDLFSDDNPLIVTAIHGSQMSHDIIFGSGPLIKSALKIQ